MLSFDRTSFGIRHYLLILPLLTFALLFTGCGGRSDSMDATPEDVDEDTPAEISEKERAAFEAPDDSVITEEQVTMYLKASLLQFDLVRQHSERLHERMQKMEERAEKGGTLAGLRNLMEAGSTIVEFGDLIGGSLVRSSRTLGYNPAEIEWVRDRMTELSTYVMFKPMQEAFAQSAQEARRNLEEMQAAMAESGEESGFTEEDIATALQNIEETESTSFDIPPSVQKNIEVLHRAKPNVTDQMWSAIGVAGGAMGLMAISGLNDPNDTEAQQKLDEYRRLFTDALENRVSPGMENEPIQ
jgi:ElaB/YqjD/DUF883 family membrane-anchored ribosome-binding protein